MVTLCGSLSRFPVSLGAAMHAAGYRALDLPFVYVPFRCEDLAGALAGMRALGIRGFGVSMPFKIEILPLLDDLVPLARRIGAVNTVVHGEGRVVGHNTDAVGAVRALEEAGVALRGASVLVLGAGGAARAVVHGLADAGAVVVVANRDRAKAEALAASAGASSVDPATADLRGFTVVVNATSVGMDTGAPGATEAQPIDLARLGTALVMDIVYKPVRTAWLRAAEARGLRAVHGGRMLLHQAAAQFELYTGRPAPLAAMHAALEAAIGG